MTNPLLPQPLISRSSGVLNGNITPPGDKSISHRAIMLGGIAKGTTSIRGLLEGEDVLRTIAALKSLGALIRKEGNVWHIEGVGVGNLRQPTETLDMGNSGTAARLLIGLLSTYPFSSTFIGDASLSKRPMGRITMPLSAMGAKFKSEHKDCLPLTVIGALEPKAITYQLPVASAQVKSAILLAGLNTEGLTCVIETAPTRDHSEHMLKHFGANISVQPHGDNAEIISLVGKSHLQGQEITVPADPSSAAFPIVAALLRPGSSITLHNIGMNPRRTGLIRTLIEMGANITLHNQHNEGGEPVADISVAGSELRGVVVPADRAPSMIDEYPILAIAASCAQGPTKMLGLGELRVKESDRLSLVATGLRRCGVNVEIEGDDLIVHGMGKPQGGATIETSMDHRIAMSFLVLGCVTRKPIQIDDGSFIATSFPSFIETMNGLGMVIENA